MPHRSGLISLAALYLLLVAFRQVAGCVKHIATDCCFWDNAAQRCTSSRCSGRELRSCCGAACVRAASRAPPSRSTARSSKCFRCSRCCQSANLSWRAVLRQRRSPLLRRRSTTGCCRCLPRSRRSRCSSSPVCIRRLSKEPVAHLHSWSGDVAVGFRFAVCGTSRFQNWYTVTACEPDRRFAFQ